MSESPEVVEEKAYNFHQNNNLTNFNPEEDDDKKEEDQMIEAFVKSQYRKRTFINPETGRKN